MTHYHLDINEVKRMWDSGERQMQRKEDIAKADLTEEQIRNWRRVLSGTTIGAYAHLMPADEIKQMATLMQRDINACSEELDDD